MQEGFFHPQGSWAAENAFFKEEKKKREKKKEKKEGERAHLVCDGQTAYTPSAPTGQLEENIYILTNTNATDGVES